MHRPRKRGVKNKASGFCQFKNHFWWSIETCDGDADILKEKWLSITSHVINRHEFPNNKVFKKCEHGVLDGSARRLQEVAYTRLSTTQCFTENHP